MRISYRILGCLLIAFGQAAIAEAQLAIEYPVPTAVRGDFLALLDRPRVLLDPQPSIEPAENRDKPDDLAVTERLTIATERKADGTLERIPILLMRPQGNKGRLPVVVVLHGTGGNKEGQQDWLRRLVRNNMIGVAIDARYHGQRSGGANRAEAYVAAITRAWETKPGEAQEHPFFYDTVWDLWRLLDYIEQRPDVDRERIGMIGFSMGGIETWLAAAVDQRVRVAIPAISVQSLRWSLDHDRWQGRARTIAAAHEAAARELGEPEINARVCRALWNKVIPGMLEQFDGPSMIRLFADRPLLILNGEDDPNCPLEGAQLAFDAARSAYRKADAEDRLQIDVAKGVAHKVTDEQHQLALDWLVRWLKPAQN